MGKRNKVGSCFKKEHKHDCEQKKSFLKEDEIKKVTLNLNDLKKNEGLTSKVAEKILRKDGFNSISSQNSVSAVKIFAGQFKDFLVLILLFSTVISMFMCEFTEAISISVILLLNAILGFMQEYRTEKTLEVLDSMVTPNAKVIRDGEVKIVPSNKLVVGDVFIINAGDVVPADAVIISSKNLEVDESVLTGEAVSISKEAGNCLNEKNDLNKTNLIYMGTSVVRGSCYAKIIATGMRTQMGLIANLIDGANEQTTPVQKKLDRVGKFLIFGCSMVSIFVIVIGIIRGEKLLEMLITGLSLAVASVPEGLPAVITVALALAVKRMIKRKALVRKLHAVEALGCANMICTDKTGTITQNKMTVKNVILNDCCFDVTGDGLETVGFFSTNGKRASVFSHPALIKILEIFVVCNGAEISEQSFKKDGEIKAIGEPTEIALLIAANKLGVTKKNVGEKFKVYDEVPFDSTKKCMSVLATSRNGEKFEFVKGAFDVIIKKCSMYEENGKLIEISKVIEFFNSKNEELTKKGMRVLAFAYKKISETCSKKNGLNFVGLCAMVDPPRKEAKLAVRMCRRAGIKPIMITGDYSLTAKAIAKEVGIFRQGDCCIDGEELNSLTDVELKEKIKKVSVFSRVSPKHKLRIVKILKEKGNVVAMTGDGVNDAPAIKEANIGVAMGESGSDVAKQAADLVLMDDNFATLIAAIEEGRIIYGNIRKFMRYLLSCNFGEILTTLLAMFMRMPLPLLSMQILVINLATDGLPAIALGLEPGSSNCMKKPPRSIRESIFSGGLLTTIIIRGILIAITTLTVFKIFFRMTMSVEISRTAAFLTLVSLQLVHVFECKSERKSIFELNYFNNLKLIFAVMFSIMLTICSIWVSPFNRIIKNQPLSFMQTILILFFVMLVPIINAIILKFRSMSRNKEEELNEI